jgi:GH24 family phage-related lysozyme (muramidase)
MTDKKQQVLDFLSRKDVEDCKLKAYKDSAGITTIGIGLARTYPNGIPIKITDICTKAQAYEWCNEHLEKSIYPALDKLCQGHNVPDPVYVALASIAYNSGVGIFQNESFKEPIANSDWKALAETFRMYHKIRVNGVLTRCEGLVNRREKEIDLFKNLIEE